MKFSATSLFDIIANGASKYPKWNVYVRKVTSLSEPLDSGTAWLDVTSFINGIPTISQKAEIETGIPVSNSLNLTGIDIKWWEANVFNATDSQYIEIKIQCQLGLSATAFATDIVYAFSGYIRKNPQENELTDTLSLTAYTLDDLLGELPGEYLTMQTMIGTDLFLPSVPGVYIHNANITSFVLKSGVHTIAYDSTVSPPTAKLDDGLAVPLIVGSNILANQYNDELTGLMVTDQKVEVIYDPTIALSNVTTTQSIIVITQGATLPSTWYQGISIRIALQKIFSLIGITTTDIGLIKFNTFDGRKTKSFFSIPPGDGTFHAQVRAIAYDNATTHKVWLGVGNQLYTFDHDTETYTLMDTLSTGWTFEKLWADASSSKGTIVGIVSDNSNLINSNKEVYVYNIAAKTSTVTAITCGYLQTIAYDNTNYVLFYLNTFVGGSSIKKFAIATSTESTYYTPSQPLDNTSAGFTDGTRYFGFSWVGGYQGLFIINASTGGGVDAFHALVGTNGAIHDGIINTSQSKCYFQFSGVGNVYAYAYNTDTLTLLETADASCFINSFTSGCAYISKQDTQSYSVSVVGVTKHTDGNCKVEVASGIIDTVISDGSSVTIASIGGTTEANGSWNITKIDSTHFTIPVKFVHTFTSGGTISGSENISTINTIKTVANTTLTSLGENINYIQDQYDYGQHLTYDIANGRYYFILRGSSILGKFDSSVSAYLGEAVDFSTQKLRDAYNAILQSMLLVGMISAAKKGIVYRRFDDSGVPVSSGNSLAINVDKAEDISRQVRYSEAISWLQISNGNVTHCYDGTNWYDDSANYVGSGNIMQLSFAVLPDNLIKDVCFYLYQYFSKNHDLFDFPLANVMPLQYECIDGADVTFSTTKIQKTASGIIFGTEIDQTGAMKASVLI